MSPLPLLVRFSRRRIAELFGARAARLYGIGVAASFGISILVIPGSPSVPIVESLLRRALISASWIVGGLTALSAARDLARRDREDGVTALVAQRGYSASALEVSRALAASVLIATWVGVPSLLLAIAAWAKVGDLGVWRWALGWTAFVVVYSTALGLVLGVLARWASRASPDRGRLLLAAFILIPELLHAVWPFLPSVPSAFGWALHRAGAGFT